ncbi:MAG: hypothetical protein WBO08_12665 [Mycobacterium sp.]
MPDETTPEDDDVRADDAPAATGKHWAGDDTDDAEAASEEQPSSSRSPVVIAVIAVLVAIATLGASAYMWRHPLTPIDAPSAPAAPAEVTFTDAQRDEAKVKVCDAFLLVSAGVTNSSSLKSEDGGAIGAIAIATNARLALYGGGQYMLNRVDPATETELAETARAFGNALMDVGAAAVAQIPSDDPAQQERVKDADTQNAKLQGICDPQ